MTNEELHLVTHPFETLILIAEQSNKLMQDPVAALIRKSGMAGWPLVE
jgi:hypothetical protein